MDDTRGSQLDNVPQQDELSAVREIVREHRLTRDQAQRLVRKFKGRKQQRLLEAIEILKQKRSRNSDGV